MKTKYLKSLIKSNNDQKTKKNDDDKKLMNLYSSTEPKKKYIFFWQCNRGPYSKTEEPSWKVFDESIQIHLNQKYLFFLKNKTNYIFNLIPPANDCSINFYKMLLYDFDTNSLHTIKVEENKNTITSNSPTKVTNANYLNSIKIEENKNIISPQLTPNKVPIIKIDLDHTETTNNRSDEDETIVMNNSTKPLIFNPKIIGCYNSYFPPTSIQPLGNEEEFIFFWQSNKNPWDVNEKKTWTPYDIEDDSKIRVAFQQYINDNSKNIIHLKQPADHYIDFSKMLEINKHDFFKSKPIQRNNPKTMADIVRINRFDNSKISDVQVDLIQQQTLNQKNYTAFFRNSDKEESKKIIKIFFKVFPNFPCELEIEESLCCLEHKSIIDIPLQKMKLILHEEIEKLGREEEPLNFDSQNIYKSHIQSIFNYKTFYTKMVYMYTLEGYLYRNLNNYLRNSKKLKIEKIKYFYISLLASFKYLSQNTIINKDMDLVVYRASRCSLNEFQQYQKGNNSNIIRIFKEFISTSINPEIAQHFFNKEDKTENDDSIKLFWEITIPKEIIKYESSNFADISEFSQFPFEKEILIKSGAIIQINEIIPFTEKIGDKIFEIKNKFRKICTLKTFSLASFFKLISLHSEIQYLHLSSNNLGENQNSMLYLKEALSINFTIKSLYLDGNNLGENIKNMKYLKEGLEKNNSIQVLNLSINNLGINESNMLYLKEALKKNNSIHTLYLYSNKLGEYEKNMQYMKEGLEKNNSITHLHLQSNKLGRNENNILYLKEVLQNNKSIKELNLRNNSLGENAKYSEYLKEGLEKNNTIQILYLMKNYLGSNERKMFEKFKKMHIEY